MSKSENHPIQKWDRMDSILARYLFLHQLNIKKAQTEEKRNECIQDFKDQTQFLIRRNCDLEFHQYLNNRLDYTRTSRRKDGLVIQKHMRMLAMFILLDKLWQSKGEFATTQDTLLGKKLTLWWRNNVSEEIPEAGLSYGHIHRMINKYYPELFTKRIELRNRLKRRKYDKNRYIDDHRSRIIETQFSRDQNIPEGIFIVIVIAAMGKDATPRFLETMIHHLRVTTTISTCDPIDKTKLLSFKHDIISMIKEIDYNPYTDAEGQKIDVNTPLFNSIVEILFLQVRLLVELRWFREKSKKIRYSIIFKKPEKPTYSRADAKKAVKALSEWHDDPEVTLHFIIQSSFVCGQYASKFLPNFGLLLSQACFAELDLNAEVKANLCYNIGIGFCETRHPRLMVKWMQKSISMYDKVGGHPGDQADAFGYIAEYWRDIDFSKYLAYRTKAEELAKSEILTKRRRAFHYLFLANCAVIWNDKNWEKILYEKGLSLCASEPSLDDFTMFFSQCLTDLEISGKRGPEGGSPDRCAPPRDWIEAQATKAFRSVVYNPDAGN